MLKIILIIFFIGIAMLGFAVYGKCREEAKRDGYVSDEYIENNEEKQNND